MLRIFVFFLILGGTVQAGPWPRAEGEGFLAFSIDTDVEKSNDASVTFYLEYGLSQNRTFGLDRRESGDRITKTTAFVRWPLGRNDRKLKLAYELGGGLVDGKIAFRPGFSIGRGFDMNEMSGWVSLDTRGIIYNGTEMALFETDFTFGLNLNEQSKLIFQIQAGLPTDQKAYAKLAPSYVLKRASGRHLTIGMTAGVLEVDDILLNIGLWQEF